MTTLGETNRMTAMFGVVLLLADEAFLFWIGSEGSGGIFASACQKALKYCGHYEELSTGSEQGRKVGELTDEDIEAGQERSRDVGIVSAASDCAKWDALFAYISQIGVVSEQVQQRTAKSV